MKYNEPTIEHYHDYTGDYLIWKLRVPISFIVENQNYRIKLSWWLLKMIWGKRHDVVVKE